LTDRDSRRERSRSRDKPSVREVNSIFAINKSSYVKSILRGEFDEEVVAVDDGKDEEDLRKIAEMMGGDDDDDDKVLNTLVQWQLLYCSI
jgi:hypothetical protein